MAAPDTSDRLKTLRAAVGALELGPDAPSRSLLVHALQAIDPSLCGDACGSAAWVFDTGMPSREWLLRPASLRDKALVEPEPADVPDEGIVRATALDPGLGQRMMERRRFVRFLRRHKMMRAIVTGTDAVGGEAFAFVDTVLPDGRWGRIRFRNAESPGLAPPSADEVEGWFTASKEDFFSRFPGACRTVVGPTRRLHSGADEDDVGLEATVEAPEGGRTHLAVPAHLLSVARQAGVGRVHTYSLTARTS